MPSLLSPASVATRLALCTSRLGLRSARAARLSSPFSTTSNLAQEQPPRLPIPSLPETLERYEASLRALIPEGDELDEEIRVIREFGDGVGPKLQQALIASDAAAAGGCCAGGC